MDVGDLPVDQLAVRRHSHPHRGVRPGRVDPPELGAHRLKCLLLIRRSTIACAPVIETVSTPPLLPPASGVCDGCPPVRRGRPLASVMDGCPSGPSGVALAIGGEAGRGLFVSRVASRMQVPDPLVVLCGTGLFFYFVPEILKFSSDSSTA